MSKTAVIVDLHVPDYGAPYPVARYEKEFRDNREDLTLHGQLKNAQLLAEQMGSKGVSIHFTSVVLKVLL